MTTHRPAAAATTADGGASASSREPRGRAVPPPAGSRREARARERAHAAAVAAAQVAAAAPAVPAAAVPATAARPGAASYSAASFVARPLVAPAALPPLPSRRSLRSGAASSGSAEAAARLQGGDDAPATRPQRAATAPRRGAAPATRPSGAASPAAGPRRAGGTAAAGRSAPAATTPRARKPRTTAAQRTTRLGVTAAMVFVGATIVSTSVPANAYFVDTPEHVAIKLAAAVDSGTTVGGTAARGQKFVASGAASAEDLGRDGYSVTSKLPGSSSGAGTFTNDSTAAVQWPFAVGVPISSGFGSRRVANCSFCSTFHQGLDFTPAAGTPIQIIADGTVSKVDQGSGALGYNVWIDHTIGGKKVTSVYAHMKAGSIRVATGQQVKVGQIVGLVGSTGNSTGAHLHFEIHVGGVPVDPYPWLEANAGKA